MATGDILSATISADGLFCTIRYDEMSAGGTHDLGGTWNGSNFGWQTGNDPASAKASISITSEGYDNTGSLTTIARTIYLVPHQQGLTSGAGYATGHGVMRKAWQGASDPVADETVVATTDLDCVYALSEPIYNDDTAATLTASSAMYNDGSNDSNSASSLSVNIASVTRDYPLPVAQWDTIGGVFTGDRIKSDFTMACQAWGKHGIACVVFDADGVTSANNVGETVTSTTAVLRSNSGLYAETWQTGDLTLSGFTQGETINGRFRIYPKVGDADSVIDTDSHTTALLIGQMRNKTAMICDKSDALDVIRYVAPSPTGNDANDGLTTGTPYETIDAAISNSANVIYMMAGNHTGNIDPGVRVANTHWYIAQPAPGESASTVTYQMSASGSNLDTQYFSFKDITIQQLGSNSRFTGGGEDHLRVTNCTMDRNAQSSSSTGDLGFDCPLALYENCGGDIAEWTSATSSGTDYFGCFDGCNTTGGNDENWKAVNRFVACDFTNTYFTEITITNNDTDNVIFHNSKMMDMDNSCSFSNPVTAGFAMVGCVLESTNSTGQQLIQIKNNIASENVLVFHNVFMGERSPMFYQDDGTSAVYGNHNAFINNSSQRAGNKHDDFDGTTNGQQAARIGQWESMMQSGSYGNVYYNTTSWTLGFPPQFLGLYSRGDTDMTFVSDKGHETGDSLGGGDYRDTNTSTNQYTSTLVERPCAFDMTGRSRPTADNLHFRGALLPVPDAPTVLVQS